MGVTEYTKPYVAPAVIIWAIYHRNGQGTDINASLLTQADLNAVLPVVVVSILIDGEWCSALIDAGFSWFIVSAVRCPLVWGGCASGND